MGNTERSAHVVGEQAWAVEGGGNVEEKHEKREKRRGDFWNIITVPMLGNATADLE